jgi:hypothetical protein
MKKFFVLAGIVFFSTSMLLTSCTTEEETDQPPTIGFVAGSGFISADASVDVNSTFSVKVFAEENATSGENLKSLKVTRVFELNSWDTTFTFNEATFSATYNFQAQASAGEESIKFEVTDNAGEKASAQLIITTQETAGGEINTFTLKILGSYESTFGSSFASIDGSVYTLAQAKTNATNVDFLYWWGASTSATIGAPDDANAQIVYSNPINGIQTWLVKNATRFQTTTVTGSQFDAIADDTEILAAAAGSAETRIPTLAAGQVIAFVSASGKHGLLKVIEIVDGAAGQITFDVRVQK